VTGPYERARADAAFLGRFRDAYAGGDDPLDALWWLEHPTSPAPSGAIAPATLLTEAQRAVYGRAGSEQALEGYALARERAERSRSAALAAVAAAQHSSGRLTAAAREGTTSASPSLEGTGRTIALRVAAVAVAVATVVGLAAGVGLGGAAHPRAAAPPVRPIVQHFQQTVRGTDALEVFRQPQRAWDLPGGAAGSLDSSTARRLVVLGDSRVLAVRTTAIPPSGVCILLIDAPAHISGACSSVQEFRRSGLVLERPGDRLPPTVRRLHWYPDGRVVWWAPES
jgi:hypothetical protein